MFVRRSKSMTARPGSADSTPLLQRLNRERSNSDARDYGLSKPYGGHGDRGDDVEDGHGPSDARRRKSPPHRPPHLDGWGRHTWSSMGEEWKAEHDWRVWVFMTVDHMYYSKLAWCVGMFMVVVTLLSCFCFVAGTTHAFSYMPRQCRHPICTPGPDSPCTDVICERKPLPTMNLLEDITVYIFLVEFLLRVGTVHAVPEWLIYWDGNVCHAKKQGGLQHSPAAKTWRYLKKQNQVIDLMIIVPFFLRKVLNTLHVNVTIIRLFRVARVLRVLKLGRYSDGAGMVLRTVRNSGPALTLLTLLTAVLTLVVGTTMYYLEAGTFKVTPQHPTGAYYRRVPGHGEQVSPFNSIPVCAYWVLITATTVGYGDMYPTSGGGQLLAAVIAYVGIVGVALPVAIVVKQFNIEYDRSVAEYEEEQRLLAREQQGVANDADQEHAIMAAKARVFIRDQLEMVAPMWQVLWEEFACKHVLSKLREFEQSGPQSRLHALHTHTHTLDVEHGKGEHTYCYVERQKARDKDAPVQPVGGAVGL